MSDNWIGSLLAAVAVTFILATAIGVSRSNRMTEESYRICVQSGHGPAECRGAR